jgi:hypothetical protein
MYFDNLTLVSLLVFAIALGSFIKVCLINSCMTINDKPEKDR